MENILSVSHNKEFDLANGETINSVYVRVYTSMFTSGLVAKMGSNRFTTLMALASYMDANGECYPTQKQLADAIGVHKNTINKYINELLEFEIDGKPLVTRTKVNRGQGKISSYYKIHPLSQLAKFEGEIEEIKSVSTKNRDKPVTNGSDQVSTNGSDESITTNCDVITVTNDNQLKYSDKDTIKVTNSNNAIKYFQQIYREVYGVNYTVKNYGKEGQIIKRNIIEPFPEMAKEIIEVSIRKYDEHFQTKRFKRPLIGMYTWAVEQIIELVEEERKLSEIASQSNEIEASEEQRMLERLSKLK